MVNVSVVVPIYNERELLDEVFSRFESAGRAFSEKHHVGFEVIYVNDGSTDGSFEKLRSYCLRASHAVCLNLSRNYGHQVAISAGIQHATGDCVVVIDGDLQDPPEFISELYAKHLEGFDVVYAVRQKRLGEGLFKRLTAALFYKMMSRLSQVTIPQNTGDFRLMSRRVVDVLVSMPEKQRYIRGLVSWIGFRQVGIVYDRDRRFAGKTHYSLSKMVGLAWHAVTSFSELPLKVISYFGFVTASVGFIYAAYVLYLRLFTGHVVQGWSSLMIVVLIIGGVQLLALGIMGEYIGGIHQESKRRPLFVVEGVYGDDATHC